MDHGQPFLLSLAELTQCYKPQEGKEWSERYRQVVDFLSHTDPRLLLLRQALLSSPEGLFQKPVILTRPQEKPALVLWGHQLVALHHLMGYPLVKVAHATEAKDSFGK